MLHRTVKENDVNQDKWIGVGGHFEKNESPEECLLREVKEETGYTLTSWQYRGIVTLYTEKTRSNICLFSRQTVLRGHRFPVMKGSWNG